ncbi:hypothetical protein [uncultured Sphingomonas sp.]|uniref:hypothetical protein n=1 Tax=uncultured Sphingomonas sp. TaxID=158754 RepID=UPI0035C943F8
MPHNPIFTKLVVEGDDKLLGMVAYAIYKTSKREWIQSFNAERGRDPEPAELAAYAATWTPQLIQNATDAATSALAEYASGAIDEARPAILKDALKGNAVRSILLNMLSALLYTLALIAIVLVLKKSGVDLLSISAS